MSEDAISIIIEKLKSVESKIDGVQQTLSDMKERSAKHSERLKRTESSAELAHTRISGVKRYLVSGLIGVASMAVSYAWSLVQAAAQK